MTKIAELIQSIQYMVAPAVMISSSALLLLGLQAKFSNLANRFRALQNERRLLAVREGRGSSENERLQNVETQVAYLMRRADYVKQSIVLSYAAIICFAGASVLIFLSLAYSAQLYGVVIAVFVAGFLCVLAAAAVLILEARLAYQVLLLEHSS